MSKIRINELARQLEVKSREVIDKLQELGIAEKVTHSSSIDEDMAEQSAALLCGRPVRRPAARPAPASRRQESSGSVGVLTSRKLAEQPSSAPVAPREYVGRPHARSRKRTSKRPLPPRPAQQRPKSRKRRTLKKISRAPLPLRPPLLGRGSPIHPPVGPRPSARPRSAAPRYTPRRRASSPKPGLRPCRSRPCRMRLPAARCRRRPGPFPQPVHRGRDRFFPVRASPCLPRRRLRRTRAPASRVRSFRSTRRRAFVPVCPSRRRRVPRTPACRRQPQMRTQQPQQLLVRPLAGQPAARPIVPPRPDLAAKLSQQQHSVRPCRARRRRLGPARRCARSRRAPASLFIRVRRVPASRPRSSAQVSAAPVFPVRACVPAVRAPCIPPLGRGGLIGPGAPPPPSDQAARRPATAVIRTRGASARVAAAAKPKRRCFGRRRAANSPRRRPSTAISPFRKASR